MAKVELTRSAVLSELSTQHPMLDPQELRVWEKAATYFMRQIGRNPTFWDVNCRANARCSYGRRQLSVPVSWSRSFRFSGYTRTVEERPITDRAAEAIGLLFLKHLTGMSVTGRVEATLYSTQPDWACDAPGHVYLENSGTRNAADVDSRVQEKLRKIPRSVYKGQWLICVSHVSGFAARFGSKGRP